MESQRFAKEITYVLEAYMIDLSDFIDTPEHPLHYVAVSVAIITRSMIVSRNALAQDFEHLAGHIGRGTVGASLLASHVQVVARDEATADAYRDALDIAIYPLQRHQVDR